MDRKIRVCSKVGCHDPATFNLGILVDGIEWKYVPLCFGHGDDVGPLVAAIKKQNAKESEVQP